MNITLSFNREELRQSMTESATVRDLVLAVLFPAPNRIEAALIQSIPRSPSNYIPAIKFVRQFSSDNNIPEYQSLAGAKAFVDKVGGYRN